MCERTLDYFGWVQAPPYGPRPNEWWREWREGDPQHLAERCYFGGPPVIWVASVAEAIALDDLYDEE